MDIEVVVRLSETIGYRCRVLNVNAAQPSLLNRRSERCLRIDGVSSTSESGCGPSTSVDVSMRSPCATSVPERVRTRDRWTVCATRRVLHHHAVPRPCRAPTTISTRPMPARTRAFPSGDRSRAPVHAAGLAGDGVDAGSVAARVRGSSTGTAQRSTPAGSSSSSASLGLPPEPRRPTAPSLERRLSTLRAARCSPTRTALRSICGRSCACALRRSAARSPPPEALPAATAHVGGRLRGADQINADIHQEHAVVFHEPVAAMATTPRACSNARAAETLPASCAGGPACNTVTRRTARGSCSATACGHENPPQAASVASASAARVLNSRALLPPRPS